MTTQLVVLLGPPGAGKSTIGEALGRQGLRWRDWEAELVERWGSREAFLADKETALAAHHGAISAWVAEDGQPAVIESTGLSDAPLLDRLCADGATVTVRLDVTEEAAAERIEHRAQGRHLTDDGGRNHAVREAYVRHVLDRRRVDLVIDTTEVPAERAAEQILAAL